MSNYTLNHTSTTTQINTNIVSGGFSELIQYEFKEPLSEYKVQKVYDSLTDTQRDNVSRHKTGFKQFVRAILLAYPAVATDSAQVHKTRSDEAKRYISRVSPHVGLSPTEGLRGYITGGTLSKKKYNHLFASSPGLTTVTDENLVYVKLGEVIMVSGTAPVSREKGLPEMYIYAIISTIAARFN